MKLTLTPTPDDFDRALDRAVDLTGVERYRYLCLAHPRPEVRAEYRAWVERIAARGSLPVVPAVSYGDPPPGPAAGGCCGGSGPAV